MTADYKALYLSDFWIGFNQLTILKAENFFRILRNIHKKIIE